MHITILLCKSTRLAPHSGIKFDLFFFLYACKVKDHEETAKGLYENVSFHVCMRAKENIRS